MQNMPSPIPVLSPAAATRVIWLAQKQGKNPVLRVSVSGGGCSGFQYVFALDADALPDDVQSETNGAKLLIDSASLPFLENCTIDFIDDLMGASFRVTNPNATASCGCGTSFAI